MRTQNFWLRVNNKTPNQLAKEKMALNGEGKDERFWRLKFAADIIRAQIGKPVIELSPNNSNTKRS